MGGRVWSKDEERVFWTYIIPQSPKRFGIDRASPEKTWTQLAAEMARKMGDKARRDYTELGLFEHYFQNAVKQRYSPNAYFYASQYVQREHEERTGFASPEEASDEDDKWPEPKRDPSAQPSETELPPFHQPNATRDTPSGSGPTKEAGRSKPISDEEQADGRSEDPEEDSTALQTAGYPSTHRPRLPSPGPPAYSGNNNHRAQRTRTEQLASRLDRRVNTTARTRARTQAATPHETEPMSLDDPFVSPSPHPSPAAHHSHGHYLGGGYPSGHTPAAHDHGYLPLTGTGYDYTMPPHNTQDAHHLLRLPHISAGPAPPADMYSPYTAAGPSYPGYGHSSPHGMPRGYNPWANHSWDQHGYAGGYNSRPDNTWGQPGPSGDYSLSSPSNNPTDQHGTGAGAGRNDNTQSHHASTTAYQVPRYHTDYQDAQPRFGPQQPAGSAPFPASGVAPRREDVSHDDNFLLASYGDDDEDGLQGDNERNDGNNHNRRGDQSAGRDQDLDADGDEDGPVDQEN